VPARLINIKYITIRAEKVASPVTALHTAHTFLVNSSLNDLQLSASVTCCPVYLIHCFGFMA